LLVIRTILVKTLPIALVVKLHFKRAAYSTAACPVIIIELWCVARVITCLILYHPRLTSITLGVIVIKVAIQIIAFLITYIIAKIFFIASFSTIPSLYKSYTNFPLHATIYIIALIFAGFSILDIFLEASLLAVSAVSPVESTYIMIAF
jgi:hypothetical protein